MKENKPNHEKAWPRGIIIAYVIFVCSTLGFVVFTFTVKFDLVVPDYYNQTLTYQDQINRKQNLTTLTEPITVQVEAGHIQVGFPYEIMNHTPSGTIELYRPSDASMDRDIIISPDSTGKQSISTTGLQPGIWTLKISFATSEKEYYGEFPVNLR